MLYHQTYLCSCNEQEERFRKRAQLLSQRIQNEAMERRAMAQEDKPVSRVVVPTGAPAVGLPNNRGGGAAGPGNVLKVKEKEVKKPLPASVATAVLVPASNTRENVENIKPNRQTSVWEANKEKGKEVVKPVIKISPELAESLAERLSKAMTKNNDNGDSVSAPARNFQDWKRKNAVPPEAQVPCGSH